MRRSPRSLSRIQELPVEVLERICAELDISGSLSRFKLPIIRVPDGWGPREYDGCRAIHLDQTF